MRLKKGDKVVVIAGSEKGKEGTIKKIDRHKRIAMIEVELFGKLTIAKVGLEIVSKTK